MSDKSSEKPQDNDEEFAPIVPPELSRVLHVDQLKSGHFVLEVEASEEERQGLAKRYDLIEVKNLTATLAFKPAASKSMIHVSANFAANVVQ